PSRAPQQIGETAKYQSRPRSFIEDVVVVVIVRPELPNLGQAESMNRSDIHFAQGCLLIGVRNLFDPAADAELHFLRGAFGESKRNDLLFRHVVDTDPPSDPPRHYFGFSGPRSGNHKNTSLG